MTCRHAKGDPNCSSHPDHPDNPNNRRHETQAPSVYSPAAFPMSTSNSPQSEEFQPQRIEIVGPHLVMEVLYPSCARCAYEGKKVMVFLNVTTLQAILWRKMDPHFADPKKAARRGPNEAPPPAARFPASKEGWQDAIEYARFKDPNSDGHLTLRKRSE